VNKQRLSALLIAALSGLAVVFLGCAQQQPQAPAGATGQEIADAHMAQWKQMNPEKAQDWVAEEKARHKIQPPADNTAILTGEQGAGHTYGNYTERDLLVWSRETEKLVVEGSRIFHNASALRSTVGVSCDMCHPDAANTHPETYPKFQVQMGRVALLRDMINWCLENPIRAPRFEPDSPEMRALEAYMYAQRKGSPLNYGKH
jgi:thiosulfate dehydrogenase